MLFNSYVFLLAFLPLTLVGFAVFSRFTQVAGTTLLVVASCVFYGWWDPRNLILLAVSITFNYLVGRACGRAEGFGRRHHAQAMLTLGVAGNLAALGYFKYANFFVGLQEVVWVD